MRLDIDPRLLFSGKTQIQLGYARDLFAAMSADGDKPFPGQITFAELEGLTYNGETFERWLKVNNIITFEEVIR